VVDFTAGEPDFPTPQAIKRAGIQAIEQDQTRYTPVAGLAPSAIYSLLHGRSLTALTAAALAADSPVAEENIRLYVNGVGWGTAVKKFTLADPRFFTNIIDWFGEFCARKPKKRWRE